MIKNTLIQILKTALTEFFAEKESLVQSKEPSYTIDVSVLPSVSSGLNQREKKLLEDLSQNDDYKSILGKIEYGLALGAMNCRDTHDIAEIRGGQKILKSLSVQLQANYPKSAFNPLTGEN